MSKGLLNNITNFHDYGIYLPRKTITIYGEIDKQKFEEVSNNLLMLDGPNRVIDIRINSEGGCSESGLAIYDAIKECEAEIRGIVYGEASSMGSIILQACDERIMKPHSYVMIHDGEEGIPAMHVRNKKKWDKHYAYLEKRLQKILVDRIKEKHPRYTYKKLQELTVFDTFLYPKQAIELGLADSVLGEG